MYGQTFSTISKYEISQKKKKKKKNKKKKTVRRESTCGQTDISTGHYSIRFTYSLKKERENKGKNGGGREGKHG